MSYNCSSNSSSIPPGKAKTTARLPLNRSAVVTSFHVNGLSPPIFSSLTRALNVTAGTAPPSLATAIDTVAMPLLMALATVDGAKALAVDSSDRTANFLNIFDANDDVE